MMGIQFVLRKQIVPHGGCYLSSLIEKGLPHGDGFQITIQTQIITFLSSYNNPSLYYYVLTQLEIQVKQQFMKKQDRNQEQDANYSIELHVEQQAEDFRQRVQNQLKKQNVLNNYDQDQNYTGRGKEQQKQNHNVYPLLKEKSGNQVNRPGREAQSMSNLKQEKKISLLTNQLNKKDVPEGSSSDKSSSLLICIEDSEMIPQVFLQSSPKGQKFISIKVPMYRTITFMKMETQIFIVEITTPGAIRDYQIQRRYSDFVELYQALFYNHPGYILAPFPGKGLESFMKIKFGLGTQEPGERCEMIQKRMFDLERFVNYVTHHRELSNSQELANFLTQDQSLYQIGKKRLQKYVQENKSLERGSQLKNIIGIGKSLWKSYMKNQEKPKKSEMILGKNDIEFGVILQTVRTEKQLTTDKLSFCLQVHMAERALSEFVDMPTENDLLLKLCSKHTSGKQYCKMFADYIEVNVLEHYKYNIRKFEQIEKALLFRVQVEESLKQARDQGNVEKRQKLSRRLEMFERNFFHDWENVFVEIEKNNRSIHEGFVKEWHNQKKLMKKIWKPSKKI